mmetsp:Transcript_30964/g.79558  ORF Transcript_30964/g.79558 Transcript_30964/m.79558 type:complete len:352 (+) Transcript_30964:3-1058(+)
MLHAALRRRAAMHTPPSQHPTHKWAHRRGKRMSCSFHGSSPKKVASARRMPARRAQSPPAASPRRGIRRHRRGIRRHRRVIRLHRRGVRRHRRGVRRHRRGLQRPPRLAEGAALRGSWGSRWGSSGCGSTRSSAGGGALRCLRSGLLCPARRSRPTAPRHSSPRVRGRAPAADAPRELQVPGHDCDPAAVQSAEPGVLEEADQEHFRSLLQREKSLHLESEGPHLHGDLPHEPLEGNLREQQLGVVLVLPHFPQRPHARPALRRCVTFRLHPRSRGSGVATRRLRLLALLRGLAPLLARRLQRNSGLGLRPRHVVCPGLHRTETRAGAHTCERVPERAAARDGWGLWTLGP